MRDILADLEQQGLEGFKSWPTAGYWFYPSYRTPLSPRNFEKTFKLALKENPALSKVSWMRTMNGFHEALRYFDAARLTWDQSRCPFDLEGFGESAVGRPARHYALTDDDSVRWGRPYLSYLRCLAALSRHVDEPPRHFLEIGPSPPTGSSRCSAGTGTPCAAAMAGRSSTAQANWRCSNGPDPRWRRAVGRIRATGCARGGIIGRDEISRVNAHQPQRSDLLDLHLRGSGRGP
ncbi:hypothetical protein [Amycolatopsis aidingensis]|uniref:hypothetical protein n=1 Tax=Amycolatopsis aidingensis TaxID=2842453 RepID=UPI001C0BA0A7|nr:hypothetical protein [Amycolatopsis aidingensis]